MLQKTTQAKYMALTFFLSFASLIYEFIIAQLLSALVGGTVLQYSITIAVYTFCLGLGSYLYTFIPVKEHGKKLFMATELMLCFFAVTLPLLALWISAKTAMFGLRLDIMLAYSAIVFLGLLSGIELPFLLDFSEEKGIVLGVDYLGMFAASVLFPWILFPYLGLFPTVLIIASLNLACALAISNKRPVTFAGVGLSLGIISFAIINGPEINQLTTALFGEKFQ